MAMVSSDYDYWRLRNALKLILYGPHSVCPSESCDSSNYRDDCWLGWHPRREQRVNLGSYRLRAFKARMADLK